MPETISLRVDGAKCYALSPYLPSFIDSARKLGGKWSDPHWAFDARDLERVRDALIASYGTDGTPGPTCSIRVALDSWGFNDTFYVCGRLVARRPGRDYRVKLGEGVVILSGGFPSSGGSMKNPRLAAETGTVVEIRDVPLAIASRATEWETQYEGDKITIVEGSIQGVAVESGSDSRSAAIDQIKALMAEHVIRLTDLAEEFEMSPC
jgi:hypothetical protein